MCFVLRRLLARAIHRIERSATTGESECTHIHIYIHRNVLAQESALRRTLRTMCTKITISPTSPSRLRSLPSYQTPSVNGSVSNRSLLSMIVVFYSEPGTESQYAILAENLLPQPFHRILASSTLAELQSPASSCYASERRRAVHDAFQDQQIRQAKIVQGTSKY